MRDATRAARRWAAALGILLAACSGEGGARADAPVGTAVGETAPPLRGRLAGGEEFSLERGSQTVVVFLQGAHCGLCREQLRRLQQHHAAYRELGAEVVAITPDPPGETAALAGQLGLAFPLVSADSAATGAWGVRPPATFLLDERGGVRFRYQGRNAADRPPDEAILSLLRQAAER